MENNSVNSLIDREGLDEAVIKVLMGDVSAPIDMLKIFKANCKSIPDKIFYRNVEKLMRGLEDKKTVKRKIGERLAKSEYGSSVGYVLLKYINSFEIPEKGKAMAYLLDAVSKDFITPTECMRLCRYLKELSLKALMFIKTNVKKKMVKGTNEDYPYIIELENHGLMYACSESGTAFELDAFLLDKYSLSYEDEKKYGSYIEKYEGIPSKENFPHKPVYLLVDDVPYMSGNINENSLVDRNVDVENEVLKLFAD